MNEDIKPILSEKAAGRLLVGTYFFSLFLCGWIIVGAFGVFR
jgi:hypothetical protein